MVIALAKAANLPLLDRVALQFTHVEWEGFRFYDLIFPLFLFMIGVAIPYALSSRIVRGVPLSKIYLHMIKRVAILFIFGLMINGRLLAYDIEKIQIYSVLQMLAFGYFFASVFFLHLRPRLQLVCTLMLLIGYWALLAFVPGPGHKIGVVARGCNVGDWVNDALLGKWQGSFRFGWIVALMGHTSTAMLGVFAVLCYAHHS